jgi:hypothetical protein
MKFIVIGHIGSDAGYWVFDGHVWRHVGGWQIEQLAEVSSALNIMREATRLKTPGLAEAAAKSVSDFVTKQLGQHLKDSGGAGGVVILA